MKIRLSQVVDAIELASEEFEYFYDTETGKTVFRTDESITGIDRNPRQAPAFRHGDAGEKLIQICQ